MIIPAHAAFVAETATLLAASEALAADPTPATLAAAQQAWQAAYVAWQPLPLSRTEAIRRTQLMSAINKYPTNPRFIEGHIASDAPLTAQQVNSFGATSRGLPALAYLLFTPSSADALAALRADARRGQYVVAAAADLHLTAVALHAFWAAEGQNYRATFIASDGAGSQLRSGVSELVNAQINALEVLVQQRLGKPLGRQAGGTPQPDQVEMAGTGVALAAQRATIHAVQELLAGGLGAYLTAHASPNPALAERLQAQLERTQAALAAIPEPLEQALSTQPDAVATAYAESRTLLMLYKVELANVLGVTVTFGDTDGD
ncbi:MAG: imelysin family protein [Chloroflexaceae bacterium]|nr:imelysin family protein [Chloroflexaceae bacterium]